MEEWGRNLEPTGRWAHFGRPVIYCSLGPLTTLYHAPQNFPKSFSLYPICSHPTWAPSHHSPLKWCFYHRFMLGRPWHVCQPQPGLFVESWWAGSDCLLNIFSICGISKRSIFAERHSVGPSISVRNRSQGHPSQCLMAVLQPPLLAFSIEILPGGGGRVERGLPCLRGSARK